MSSAAIAVNVNAGTYYSDNRSTIVVDESWKALIDSIEWIINKDATTGITTFTSSLDNRTLEQVLLNVPATTTVIHLNAVAYDFRSGNLSVAAS